MATKLVKNQRKQPNEPKKILPAVKFTGQQPGEEGVEPDREPQERPGNDSRDVETDEKLDERGLPENEPSTEGKFSA
jgi:hypothetical protein